MDAAVKRKTSSTDAQKGIASQSSVFTD